MPQVAIGWEVDWETFWLEGEALAKAEHAEILLHDPRPEPFKPAVSTLRGLHSMGLLLILSARSESRLVGFFTWTREPNLESEDSWVIRQGAVYMEAPFGGFVPRMLRKSLLEFSVTFGPCRVICHRPLSGRGSRLGVVFGRLGFVESSVEYSTFLGVPPHA